MKNFLFLFLTLASLQIVQAQEKFVVSGYVKDAETSIGIIGATVYVEELKNGTYTDDNGYFKFSISKGTYNIKFSSLGFDAQSRKVEVNKNIELEILLNEEVFELEEVEVKGEKANQNIKSTEMGTVKLEMAEIKSVPVLFGETDVLKTLTLLPGVQTTTDGNTGLYVRGGGPDQNLVLLDNASVYNPTHLLGFFSVFNADALKDVKLYKGGIPAQFGGRLSSALDIRTRNGNPEKLGVSGGIGVISSRLTLEGPLVKDKSTFLISGRRTYADLFLKLSNNESLRNSRLYFYDMNLKADYKISDKDHLFLSGYYGRDVFGFSNTFGFDWGNAASTLRWNHYYNEKLSHNASLIFSNYDYSFKIRFTDNEIRLLSGIQSYNVRSDWDWQPNMRNTVTFGISSIYHNFSLPSFRSNIPGFETVTIPGRNALENGIYIQNEYILNPRFTLNYGIRYSLFNLMGPGDVYSFDEARENVTDTATYGRGEIYKSYGGFEPRLAMTYILNPTSSIKLSYNRTRQYIHLLSNAGAASPVDLWIPTSNVISPQIGDQVSAGYFKDLNNEMYETSVEVYYKNMQNQIDYKNGANITFNPTIETELLFGRGWAYGAEFFVKKKKGKLTGWVAYTLSRSIRQVEGINDGNPFPARSDRLHDFSVVGSYPISDRWKFAGTWVYATGIPVTFPVGKYEYEGRIIDFYTGRNDYRLPSYHRMDISFTYDPPLKEGRSFHSSWNISFFNFYARQNPFSIVFRESETEPGKTEAVQIALFRIIPSVTWNFKF